MRNKGKIGLVMLGALGTIAYQQIKNGNAKHLIEKYKNKELDMVSKLEDMM